MPQSYYNYSNTFIDGQTAKASEVKAEYQAIETGLDDFHAEINAYVDSEIATVNASISTTNSNVTINTNAMAALNNFKGTWSSLTGALAMPASVHHSNSYWILNTDLADVTLKEPGVDTEWNQAGARNGGEELSLSADTALTTANKQFQRVTASATDLTITLPDLTGAPQANAFVIANVGVNKFFVSDGTAVLGAVDRREIAYLSSSDTQWSITNVSADEFYQTENSVFESANSSYISVDMLSSTQAIAVYADAGNSNYGTAVILDIDGGAITPGTPAVYESATSFHKVVALSSTKALVTYCDSGNSNYGTACVLDVSGSTITPGTPFVFGGTVAFNVTDMGLAKLSSTRAIVAYRGTSTAPHAILLDVSGTTITPSSAAQIDASAADSVSVCALSSTQALAVYSDVTSTDGEACVLDISGSTITPATPATLYSARIYYTDVVAISSTKAITVYSENNTNSVVRVLSISGSTITPNTSVIYSAGNTDFNNIELLGSTKAIATYYDITNGVGKAQVIDIDDTTVTSNTTYEFHSSASNYIGTALIDTSSIIACWQGTSGYGTATILGVPQL